MCKEKLDSNQIPAVDNGVFFDVVTEFAVDQIHQGLGSNAFQILMFTGCQWQHKWSGKVSDQVRLFRCCREGENMRMSLCYIEVNRESPDTRFQMQSN